MHGDTERLLPTGDCGADPGSSSSVERREPAPREQPAEAAGIQLEEAPSCECAACEEVRAFIVSWLRAEEAREGQRRGEGLHGAHSQDAEVGDG